MAKKKKKKQVLKVKNIMILLLILVSLGGLFYYAINMPIKNIYITGNDMISDEEIFKLSGLDKYPSFLLTKKSEIKESLKKNEYIKEVKVTKKIGNIIELTIIEYQAVAITLEEKVLLSNGETLDNTYELNDVPILSNSIENESIAKSFAKKFGNIKTNILRQISQIEYSPVAVDEERFLLYMNDGNLVYITLTKINKLNKYNRIKDKLNGQTGIIYLDSGDYVELKKEPSPEDVDNNLSKNSPSANNSE